MANISMAVLLFLLNAVKFIMDENSNIPVLNILFGMWIIIFIIIYLICKNITDSRLNGINGWIQTILDKYFNNNKPTR